jgi:hypothetical protein
LVSLVFDMDRYKKLNFDVDCLCQPVYKLIFKKKSHEPRSRPIQTRSEPTVVGPRWRRLGGVRAVLEEPVLALSWRSPSALPCRSPPPPRQAQVDLATLDTVYTAVLEAESAVDGALDGLGPLLRCEHHHLLHHQLDVAPSPSMCKATPRSCGCRR